MKKTLLQFVVLCLVVTSASAFENTSGLWTKINSEDLEDNLWERSNQPQTSDYYQLDYDSMLQLLNSTDSRLASDRSGVLISIPNAQGEFSTFEVYEASVLHEELQQRHPEIGSYTGFNIDRPAEKIRISKSHRGVNMIVLNPWSGTFYVDAISKSGAQYIVYSNSDLPQDLHSWQCGTEETNEPGGFGSINATNRNANDSQLRTFRIAIACTEEYAAFHVNQAGLNDGTNEEKKAAVLGVMNDKMTRVNAVYENSLSFNFEIVPGNENIIFLNSSTFLNNGNYSELLGQSQTAIDDIIGSANYDIGHMFATGPGGVVSGRTCAFGSKARGITGTPSPIGNQFEGILMHEIGHQFSAGHTWNGNANGCSPGQYSTVSAYEPGSGSTIMGYAGLCGSQNIQTQRDLYFHQISLAQMWDHVTNGIANGCPELTTIPNSAPTADAGPDYIIPRRTPYKLVGSATDEKDTSGLTYCWEQFDLGDPGIPAANATTGPLVRSFPPQESSTRYIPRLQDYKDTFGQSTEWEVLSSADRTMTFKFTVRDNDVAGGQIAVDEMVITVSTEPGQFRVNSQNQVNLSYEGGSTQEVTWLVSGSDEAPINVSQVNILLSTDGGITFDQVLATGVPNNGSAMVTLPDIDAASCRFMVEAVGNIFYNINFRDFSIEKSLSIEEATIENLAIYPNPNNGTFNVEFDPTNPSGVKLQVYDLRGRRVFSQNYANSGRLSEQLNLSNADSGLYLLEIEDGQRKTTKKIIIN